MNTAELSNRVRMWGWRRSAYWYFMVFLQRVFGLHLHYVFFSAGLSERMTFPVEPGYEHREVEPIELLPYIRGDAAVSAQLSSEFLEASQANGDECIASFFHDRLVGFDFSCTTRAPVSPQLDLVVPTGFRYGYKGWTHPDHRRKKLALRRIQIKRTNAQMAVYYIETHNYPSLLRPYRYPSARRLHMGYAGWIEAFGRLYPFASRRAIWLGFEFVRKGTEHRRLYTEL